MKYFIAYTYYSEELKWDVYVGVDVFLEICS